ncbi:hypothetical protein JHK85_016557 [Glycine max]|nr:hypothetical protein JHK85_016557 [Glycine max]
MVVIHLDDGDDIYDIEKTLIVALANSSRSSAKDKSTMAAEPLASSTWDHSSYRTRTIGSILLKGNPTRAIMGIKRKQDYGGAARQMAEQAAMSKQRALETAEWATS